MLLRAQPGVRDRAQLGHAAAATSSAATTSKCSPPRSQPAQRVAQLLAVAAVEREVGERHARLLAELEQRQPEIDVEVAASSLTW